MRQIKASEVKPGMTIRFDLSGWDVTGTVGTVKVLPRSVWIYTEKCRVMSLELDSPVTVLVEAQPEEPQEFGAKVRVRDGRFVRLDWVGSSSRPWHEKETGYRCTWDDLCERGPVTVLPDQGWTIPQDADTDPEVPDRIEEWPENDEHLRKHKWKDRRGDVWSCWDGAWGYQSHGSAWRKPVVMTRPFDGPWTRVTDA